MKPRDLAVTAAALTLVAAIHGLTRAADPNQEVRAMVRRVLDAPEVTGRVVMERSDPFGGSPVRERGRLWYIPGRGLRYQQSRKGGQDLVVDKEQEAFLLYSAQEGTVYRAPFARAPARIRRLIENPERILDKDLQAVPEWRRIGKATRSGYRLGSTALGDSMPRVSVWLAADPVSGLPRWISIRSEDESLLVELEGLAVRKTARPVDLTLSAPPGTPEQPLDPRELLREDRGETR